MKVDTTKKGLVRGYVIYADSQAGCISLDAAKDENNLDVGVAYTMWHRHDDNPLIVEGELKKLSDCYRSFTNWSGIMEGFEYREYRR